MRFVVPLLWIFTLYVLPLISVWALIRGSEVGYRIGVAWWQGQRPKLGAIGLLVMLLTVGGVGLYHVSCAILTIATSGH